MRVVELHEEMEVGGKEVKEVKDVINFDQLVRIQVDTDVDTHFIVSLSRTSTVAELRELVKATHRHCYPDSGDVDIGKLAVPGRDYGYHLADFLLIGQVYERFKGKVFAEVKNHDPASISSQGLSRMQARSLKTSSTQKKVPLLAPQSFENVAAQISTNTSGYVPRLDPRGAVVEPRALLPVELNSCEPQIVELLVPKLQKEEIDEDGNCYLLSQEPLDGFPSKVRGLAVGSFERIVEEEDEKVVERLSIAVNDDGGVDVSGADLVPKVDHLDPDMDLADLHMKASETSGGAVHALSSDIQGVSRKRVASESNERPSKLRRLAEQTPSGNTSKAPLENGRNESGNREIELSKDESPNLDGVNDVVKDVNTSASLSHMNRAGDLDPNYLSGSKRKKKEALQSCDLTIGENQSEAENDAMFGVEDKEEMYSGEVGRKERPGGTHLVTGSGLEDSGNNCLEVGREEKSSLPENVGVLPSFGQKGKKKQKLKKEKVPEQEKTQKRKKKGGIQKPVKETEQEQSEREEEPELEKGKKQKKGKSKQEKELKQEKEKRERERRERDRQEIELERKKQENEKQEREKQEQEKQEQEKQEEEKQERELKQEQEKQEREKQEQEKQEMELKHEREKQEIEKERKKQEKELKKEKEKQEREKQEKEKQERVKQEKEKQEKEKQEKEKQEREKQEKEKQEREKQEKEKQEREKQEKEKQEKEKQEKEKQEKEKQEKEKQEKEKQEREKQEKEKQEKEKQEREKQEKEKQEREKQEKEKQEREKQEKEKEKQERKLKQEQEKQKRDLKQEKKNQEKEKQERDLKQEQEKEKQEKEKQERELKHEREKQEIEQERKKRERGRKKQEKREKKEMDKRDKEKTEEKKEKKEKKQKQTIDEDSGRLSASDIVRDEISESGTPQREAQVSRGTSGEDMIQDGAVAIESENIDVEETSPQVGSVESKETPSPSKPLSYTRAGRGAPSQTRSIASFRDVTKSKQIGGMDETNESQSSQFLEKATQQSEGINLGSEVTGAWLRRSRLESEGGGVDQSQIPKSGEVAHSRSSTGGSSAESGPRFADQTEVRSYQDVSRKEDEILEALHTNHAFRTVERSEKHANTSAKRTDGDVNIKNDSLEFFSQDQSFHVAPTQVEKALSDSSTEDNSDESETDSDEDTDKLKKQTSGNLNITQRGPGESKESSDESGDLARPGSGGFPSLTTRTPVPSGNFPVSRMIGNGGSQSFKRRSSGVSAEIEAKFAQFIESQGGLDEIMGITLGQQKCSLPVESSTQVGLGARSTGSMATPFGSPLDLALNTQESVKYSPIALDIAQASQNSAEKFKTPQFKVPKSVPVGTMSGFQGVFNSAATTVALAGRKGSNLKELRLRRRESTPPVDNEKEAGSLLVKHNNDISLPALQSSKETFLGDKDAAKWKPKSVGNSSPSLRPETLKVTFLDALNTVGKSSKKTKRSEEELQDSQFMIVNNTDHILEDDRRVKKLGSKGETKGSSGLEDGSLVSPKSGMDSKERKVKFEFVETDMFGSPDMVVPDTSGKKRRKEPGKEGSRKKRMKFPPEELDGKEVTILPENSVERSARETEELYVKLEKANRDLWLKSNSVSSFKKGDEKIGNRNYPAADLDDTEGAEGEDVAQSRLVGRESEIDDVGNHNSKVVDEAAVDEGDPADRDPSPELCAGTTEASDREDSAFESQDVKAETSEQDVFDFVSGDELPTKVLSKSNEKKNSKRMEELSGKAVQRVLEDEMLHVVDTGDIPVRKARKSSSPVNWTVKSRLSPIPLAPSLFGGIVPSNAAEVRSSPNIMRGSVIGEGKAPVKPPRKSKAAEIGPFICPVGCGKEYVNKTSSYYEHKKTCSGAPKTPKKPKTREL